MCLEKGKMQPPEMAVFSFIDLPDVLTDKKGEHIVKKTEKNQIKTKATSIEDDKLPLDINGKPIDPKRKYIGKKIKIPIASPDCSLYNNDATIIIFGKTMKSRRKNASRKKFEEFLKRAPISFDKEE